MGMRRASFRGRGSVVNPFKEADMSCLRIRTLFTVPLLLAMLMAFAGCSGDRRERSHRHPDRYPERYERHDDDRRYGEQRDGDWHEDRERPSGRDRRDRDKR